MTQVFFLKATGLDGFSESHMRTVTTTNGFTTRALAEDRIEKFRAMLLEGNMMLEPIEIEVTAHEVVE